MRQIFTCRAQEQFAVKTYTRQEDFSASTNRGNFKLNSGRLCFKLSNLYVIFSSC